MKKFMANCYIILLLLLISNIIALSQSLTHFTSFEKMCPDFQNPPSEFRPAPFWVWHDKLQREMMSRDLQNFKSNGFGGGFIHPRYGLITEYLSDEWFDMVDFAVQNAKKLDLKTWIYDENSFPSGFAGGWVPELLPESYNQGAGLVLKKVVKIPEGDFEIILQEKDGQWQDISKTAQPGDEGSYYIFEKTFFEKSKWFAGRSYVDLLIPGVTEKFIEITMKGYEDRVGQEFGKTIPGVFTDEPNISPRDNNAMRWTPALFEEFEKRWGYDLKTTLPAIFVEAGEWKKVRHNYYELLLDMFIQHWSKPWFEYTEEKKLLWTGHYWEHGWPSPVEGGDNMAMYAWHQMPAIDMLFNTADQNNTQFGNIRAVKELASIANQMGRVRTLSETYGAAGWELTFQDMKRYGDWEYVLGVNFLNQHLTYMNLTGDRKHDFPQGICYQTPWWKDYEVLNDYFARLSVALSSGKQKNHILVLEPTTTAWMYYSPQKSNSQLRVIDESFHQFLSSLEDYHIEYDLGCENTIKNFAHVKDNIFIIGQREYNTIILPPHFENFDRTTFELLKNYSKNNGRILNFSKNLKFVDGAQEKNVQDILKGKAWKQLENVQNILLNTTSHFEMLKPKEIGGDLYHMRRQLTDGELIFLVNFSIKESSSGAFIIDGYSMVELDAFTGQQKPYPSQSENKRQTVYFDVPPVGSLLLYASEKKQEKITSQSIKKSIVIEATPAKIERISPNLLTLDYVNLNLKDKDYNNMYFYTAGFEIWKAHGYSENPWVSSVQWKSEWVDADTFAEESGFEAHYPFIVSKGVDLASLHAVVEQPNLWKVLVNGNQVKVMTNNWAIDETFGVFNIGHLVKIGENTISVIMKPMSIYAEIEPVYVMGNFDLESQNQGWKLIPQTTLDFGSWKEQGLPFYAYDVAYRKKAQFSKGLKVKIHLGQWNGTVASVYVNENKAGIIGWQPYEVDISDHIKDGQNDIAVVVTGSFKNLLGPHHNVERWGIVTPWSFKYAPEKQPKGEKYDLLDYGLMEDFVIIVQE